VIPTVPITPIYHVKTSGITRTYKSNPSKAYLASITADLHNTAAIRSLSLDIPGFDLEPTDPPFTPLPVEPDTGEEPLDDD